MLERAAVPVIVGIGAGLLMASLLTRLLQSMLFEVTLTDPAVFALVAAMLMFVGVVASLPPARRAAHIDPIEALRTE